MNIRKIQALLLALLLAVSGVAAAAAQGETVIGGADGPTGIVITETEAQDEAVIGGADGATDIVIADTEAQEDVVLASAYNGEVSVKLSEVKEEFDAMLQSYISYYAQYGYEIDEYDTDLQDAVAQETVQLRISQLVAERHAAQTGYVLTEEMDAGYKAEAQAALDEMSAYYREYLSSYGVAEEEIDGVVAEELAAVGYTFDALYESAKLKGMLDHLYALSIEGVEVTGEEVEQAFNARVEEQKAAYDADVDSFINAYLNEEDILYTPENVRLMHCIYFEPDEIAEEATPDEATAAETAVPAGLARANDALARIRGGEDFTAVMEACNEDASTPEQMAHGYPVAEGSALYSDEFKAGAMALANVGDVSDVIVTEQGYFILKYVQDMTAGAVDFESRKETETAQTLSDKQNSAYSAYIDSMLEEAEIVVEDLSPLFHVYVAESVEATIAYASVAAQTDLTDMPAGEPVATLSAGASLDVLGRITVDGVEYAFVSVPGTAFKGYVNTAAMSEMAEADALAVDNAALAAACTAQGELPVFTITMNDGSVIYGELYPEQAPESVGNFVSLANSGFYDGLIFHRVIPGFMIQGGDPNGDGTGGPGYAIKGEFANNGVENPLSHTRGVLSMARSSAMDSAGSQFFIMHADSDYLDGDYAAFGLVLGGLETVDLIASQPTNSNDRPRTDQTMRTVYVETYGQAYGFTKLED